MTTTKQQAFAKDLQQLIQKYLPAVPCGDDFAPILDVLAEVKEKLELDSMRYPLEDWTTCPIVTALRGAEAAGEAAVGALLESGRVAKSTHSSSSSGGENCRAHTRCLVLRRSMRADRPPQPEGYVGDPAEPRNCICDSSLASSQARGAIRSKGKDWQ
jgi:hypothetical protein